MSKELPTEIRVRMGEKIGKIFLEVKEYYLLENSSEVVRTLIREKYEELQKEKEEKEREERAVDLSLKKDN